MIKDVASHLFSIVSNSLSYITVPKSNRKKIQTQDKNKPQ